MLTRERTLLIAKIASEYRVEETAAPIFRSDGTVARLRSVFSQCHGNTAPAGFRSAGGPAADAASPIRTLLFDRIDRAIVAAKRHGRILRVPPLSLDNFR